MLKSNTEERIATRQYLLGDLPPGSLRLLEERILGDKDFYEELLIAEDELVDEYLADRLSQAERHLFESHFLIAPERQHKVRFGGALRKYVNLHKSDATKSVTTGLVDRGYMDRKLRALKSSRLFWPFNRNPILAFSLIIAVCLGLAAFWIIHQKRSSETVVHQDSQNILTIALSSRSTRGDGVTQRVSIPPRIDAVRLQLELIRNEYKSYNVALLTLENESLSVGHTIKPSAAGAENIIYFIVPSDILPPGDYQVQVSGIAESGRLEPLEKFYFRVVIL